MNSQVSQEPFLHPYGGGTIQDPGYGLRRMPLLGTWVNKGKRKDRDCYQTPALLNLAPEADERLAASSRVWCQLFFEEGNEEEPCHCRRKGLEPRFFLLYCLLKGTVDDPHPLAVWCH
jgi:hypothetical protein